MRTRKLSNVVVTPATFDIPLCRSTAMPFCSTCATAWLLGGMCREEPSCTR